MTKKPPASQNPAPTAPQPTSTIDGLLARRKRYRDLQKRARVDSMAWWWLRIVQGAWFVGAMFALDVVLLVIVAIYAGKNDLWVDLQPILGGIALLGFGRNLTAPLNNQFRFLFTGDDNTIENVVLRTVMAVLSCRWIVVVPQNWTYVVENDDEFVQQYLKEGYNNARWAWGMRVVPYSKISFIPCRDIVLDEILDSRRMPVKITVHINLSFDATRADPKFYGMIREWTELKTFDGIIRAQVSDAVTHYVNNHNMSDSQPVAGGLVARLEDSHPLADHVRDELRQFEEMGISVLDKNPTIHIVHPQSSQLNYRLEHAQNIEDLKQIALEHNLPPEEISRMYRAMRTSSYTTRTGRRRGGPPPIFMMDQQQSAPSDPDPGDDTPEPEQTAASAPDEPYDPWADVRAFFKKDQVPKSSSLSRRTSRLTTPRPTNGDHDDGNPPPGRNGR